MSIRESLERQLSRNPEVRTALRAQAFTEPRKLEIAERWASFLKFCSAQVDAPPPKVPAAHRYLASLRESRRAPAYVRRVAWSLALVLAPKAPAPLADELAPAVAVGTGVRDGQTEGPALSRGDLVRLTREPAQTPAERRFRAIILLGFYLDASVDQILRLRTTDFEADPPVIRLPLAKPGVSIARPLARGAQDPCLVQAIEAWLEDVPMKPGRMFCNLDPHGTPLAEAMSRDGLKGAVKAGFAAAALGHGLGFWSARLGGRLELARDRGDAFDPPSGTNILTHPTWASYRRKSQAGNDNAPGGDEKRAADTGGEPGTREQRRYEAFVDWSNQQKRPIAGLRGDRLVAQIDAYLTHLAKRGTRAASICHIRGSIEGVLAWRGVPNIAGRMELRRVERALKEEEPRATTPPATPEDFAKLLDAAARMSGLPGIQGPALLHLANSSLRSAEVLALALSDIVILDHEVQVGKEPERLPARPEDPDHCPVQAIRDWSAKLEGMEAPGDGHLFWSISAEDELLTPLGRMNTWFEGLLKSARLENRGLVPRSLRLGWQMMQVLAHPEDAPARLGIERTTADEALSRAFARGLSLPASVAPAFEEQVPLASEPNRTVSLAAIFGCGDVSACTVHQVVQVANMLRAGRIRVEPVRLPKKSALQGAHMRQLQARGPAHQRSSENVQTLRELAATWMIGRYGAFSVREPAVSYPRVGAAALASVDGNVKVECGFASVIKLLDGLEYGETVLVVPHRRLLGGRSRVEGFLFTPARARPAV